MKAGWKIVKLGDIATFLRGLTYSKNDETEFSDKIVLRSNNVDLSSGKLDFTELKYLRPSFEIPVEKMVKKGSLLMCMSNGSKAHLGKVALIDNDYPYAFGGFMGLVVPQANVSGQYLHFALSSPFYKEFIKSLSAGANINNIKTKDLAEFSFPLPSLPEQERIVAYLDTQFAKIDAMKANAAKALAEAKALFQSALTEAMTPKEGWKEKTIKEVGKTQTGSTPSKVVAEYYGDYIPFIRPAELNVDEAGGINYNSEIKLSEKGLTKGRLIPKGSILMCCIGTVGKTGFSVIDVSCNQQINTVTPYLDCPKFVYYAMISRSFQELVIKIANSAQATLPIINKGKWEALNISLPPLPEQERIVTHLDALSAKVAALEANYTQTVAECDALKQALLREVFE